MTVRRPAAIPGPDALAGFGRLDREDLVEPAAVARLAAELGAEERERAFERQLRTDDPRAQHQHVHVIVLDALVGGVRVVADRRANAADLAGRDRGADAGAADQDAAVREPATDGLTQSLREVRVVVMRIGSVAAEVDELVVGAGLTDPPNQVVLQRCAGMVRGESDAHAGSVVAGVGPGP